MEYIIHYKDRKGVCPKCGGLLYTLNSDEIIIKCVDCCSYFKVKGEGQAEAELNFIEMELKQQI